MGRDPGIRDRVTALILDDECNLRGVVALQHHWVGCGMTSLFDQPICGSERVSGRQGGRLDCVLPFPRNQSGQPKAAVSLARRGERLLSISSARPGLKNHDNAGLPDWPAQTIENSAGEVV